MSQRRMFNHDIVESDTFLEMPISSQALYFHLGMYADDDGFVSPKKIMRMMNAGDDDLKVLITKRFVLPFDSGVVVIKHWLIHNLIRADLYKETLHKVEKAKLGLNENGAYTELRNGIAELKKIEAPDWLKKRRKEPLRTENVPQTVHRLGKDRKEQYTAGKPAPSAEDSFLKAKEFQAPDPRKNPHGIIIDFYFNRVKELYGFEPEINGKKDGQLLKTRLTKYKPTQICALIDWYLHSDISERLGCSLATALSANTINRWKQENGNK